MTFYIVADAAASRDRGFNPSQPLTIADVPGPMKQSDARQELLTISSALAYALSISLRAVAELSGSYAHDNVELLRDEVLKAYKNAEVPAELDLEQAKIVGPALRALRSVFEKVLEDIP